MDVTPPSVSSGFSTGPSPTTPLASLPLPQTFNGLVGGLGALDPATKHARKIYVGNLPVMTTEPMLTQFFNEALESLLPSKPPGPPIIGCYLNLQRRFAFLEHRTIEEANFTLGLDGLQFAGHALKLRRPQDYNPALAEAQLRVEKGGDPTATVSVAPQADAVAGALGIISTTVDDSPNKVFIGGLPHHLNENDVKQILSAFGALKSFHLVKDNAGVAGVATPTPPDGEKSKGFAFCEWRDANVTDTACQALNGMRIGDRTLNVRRAVPHAIHKAAALGMPSTPIPLTPSAFSNFGVGATGTSGGVIPLVGVGIGSTDTPATADSAIGRISRVVAVRGALQDGVEQHEDDEKEAAQMVLEAECRKIGAVKSLHWHENDVLLVEFGSTQSAVKALNSLQISPLDGRPLHCTFMEPTEEIRRAAIQRIKNEVEADYAALLARRVELGLSLPTDADDILS